ncbi:MAG: hypothetical protein Q9163_001279 [Psora crenata]
MPPHGRRRLFSPAIVLSLLFLFISTASAVSSAVLGIDFGTEYLKAALVKPGVPLDIVLAKDSKRKETAAIAFKALRSRVNSAEGGDFPERIYGTDAVALSARFPKDVYTNLKPLLGLGLKSQTVSNYGSLRPELQIVEWGETGTVGFKSDSFVQDEEPYLVEELLAMELKNIKGNAESLAGKGYSVEDVVITVPSFYTVEERRAVTMAAELAGLRVLSLISDGLAVGLNYATSRTFPSISESGKPEIHLVYDMGAGSTTATVLKFQGRTVKDVGRFNKTIQEVHVLGTGWDKSLGGDALNAVIIDDIVSKFTQQPGVKKLGLKPERVKSHGRTMAKLLKESERIRQVLSANTETSANFESLYSEDQNLKYKLSRTDFEELASEYLSRVQAPILEALDSANLTLDDLNSVILHGGAVRTPFVQKQLEAVIEDPNKIRTNVNSDEAAVFGAGFKAAAISPSFRVKEIRASDSAVYPIFASWTTEGKNRQQKLFVPASQVGAEKQVTLKAIADFDFDLFQRAPAAPTDLAVSHIKTRNLTESVKALTSKAGCAASDISTIFAIRLNPRDGLPEVLSGSISCVTTEPEKKGVVDGMKDFLGFGSKKDDQHPLQEEVDSSSTSSLIESETPTTVATTETRTSGSATESNTKVAEKTKAANKRDVTIPIAFISEATGSSSIEPDSLARIKKRLRAFDASDRSRVLREETLNNLESYTYRIRDILEDEAFIAASTLAQREEIEDKSNDASMWLYGDGAEASREALKARLDELRGLVKPIQRRKDEAVKRPDAVKQLQDGIGQAKTMVSVIKQQQEAQSMAGSASTASASQATTVPSTSTSDDFSDLDDEPTPSSTKYTSPEMPAPIYSEADLAAIVEKQESAQSWLDAKSAEQGKLSPTDDPVLLSSETLARAKELNEMVNNLLMKQIKATKPRKAKASTKTTKTKSTSSSNSETDSGSSKTTEAESSSAASTEGEFSPAPAVETEKPTDVAGAGDWATASDSQRDQGMPTLEEEMEMRRIQQEIDEQLAAEKSSIVAKNRAANTRKEKKAKTTAKAKTKGKGKEKAKKEEHGEL